MEYDSRNRRELISGNRCNRNMFNGYTDSVLYVQVTVGWVVQLRGGGIGRRSVERIVLNKLPALMPRIVRCKSLPSQSSHSSQP